MENTLKIKQKLTNDKSGTAKKCFFKIYNADMKNARVNEDGSMTVDLRDWYDFAKWKLREHPQNEKFDEWLNNAKYNGIVRANNNAYKQQQVGQLEQYLMNMPMTLTKEELEELKERLKKRNRKRL